MLVNGVSCDSGLTNDSIWPSPTQLMVWGASNLSIKATKNHKNSHIIMTILHNKNTMYIYVYLCPKIHVVLDSASVDRLDIAFRLS